MCIYLSLFFLDAIWSNVSNLITSTTVSARREIGKNGSHVVRTIWWLTHSTRNWSEDVIMCADHAGINVTNIKEKFNGKHMPQSKIHQFQTASLKSECNIVLKNALETLGSQTFHSTYSMPNACAKNRKQLQFPIDFKQISQSTSKYRTWYLLGKILSRYFKYCRRFSDTDRD